MMSDLEHFYVSNLDHFAMSTLAVDSGIYSTDTSEIDIDVKIVVDSTEMDNKADSDGDIASSGCTGRNESHTDYLQVPSSIDTLGNTQHRGSLASIVVDVFTPENITTVLKLRLATTITVIICIMLLLFVTPIVWYNVDRPTLELTTIEYESMVRNKCNETEMSNTMLLSDCEINETEYQDCEFDSTILGLHLVYFIGTFLNSSTQCLTDNTLSFFCNATLLLCNGNSFLVDLTEECKEVRDNKCASEWRIVESICDTAVVNFSSYSGDGNLTFSKAPNQNCPPGFDHLSDSRCFPVCGENYLSIDDSSVDYFPIVVTICGIIGFIGGVITLIAYYYRRNKLFQFPQIYIVYNTVSWMIIWWILML
ncbi:uncharacterized protein [Dysidea avara]|uniref:uncharacterized protein isoform X1 n=2 Tax=Dysidea avara TaxID=196820 RepID=UPI00331A9896